MVGRYAEMCKFRFNVRKSKVMVVGKTPVVRSEKLVMKRWKK